jgi:predicted MFS family arabinose efflux permease
MLITGWVSSRLGAKNTLVLGLAVIVVFAFLAGASDGIGGIVGFRAGWGMGNALFIATSLAVIVGSASGGFAGAIVLYETALGVGIACGPLLGALLGSWSRRGPFFGVSVLMAIALVATLVPLPRTPKPAHPASLGEPLRALRHRGLLTMGVTALLYNWGFFTMLGYVPFPMGLSIYGLGAVFFGWGVLVAIFSVFVAPRLQTRFGTAPVLYVNLAMFAALLAVIATFTDSPATLATCVVVAGAFIGINNTLTTQAVMLVAPVERPVASAATSSSGSSAVAWPRGWRASWPSGSACPCPSTWEPSPCSSPPACSPRGTACWPGPTRRSRPGRRPTPVRPTSTRPSWRRSSRTARARPERGSGRRSRRCTEPAAAGFTSAAEGTRTGWTCTSSPS